MEISENVLASGMRLWYARPDTNEPRPLMVMLHERYGPVEQSGNVISRMASYGYVACLADLFHRYEGDRGPIERSEARYDPTDAQTVTDIDESIAFMHSLDFVDPSNIGIVGFCQSGRTPMVYSAAGRDVTVAALFHGGIYPRDYEPDVRGAGAHRRRYPPRRGTHPRGLRRARPSGAAGEHPPLPWRVGSVR